MKRAIHGRRAAGALLALAALATLPALGQRARFMINDDCIAFTFSPDGSRIVYAARRISRERVSKTRRAVVEHDEIWQATLNGHVKRLVEGSKLAASLAVTSYQIQAIRFSPDGRDMTLEMATQSFGAGEQEQAQEGRPGQLVALMDGDGKGIPIAGAKAGQSTIANATNATWLADGRTVVYLTQPAQGPFYEIGYVRPSDGQTGRILAGHAFAAAAWLPGREAGAAVESETNEEGALRLVWLDLAQRSERTLATLGQFSGHLSVSPSGGQIAYYSDRDTIEIRSLANPAAVTRFAVPYGRYEWSPDGTHLLLKRGSDQEADQLFWVSLPSGNFAAVFHELIFRNFHISPDGQSVGVTEPGKQMLQLYPAP